MSEYLNKIIRQGNCEGIRCIECDFDAFCNEVECAFPYGLIVWAAKGMLYEMEASSRVIFEWLHDLYAEVNHEITVTFNQHNRIEDLSVTLVEVDNNILYFDVNGKDVRVEKHMCTEPFAKEQLLLTDILTASYTVVKDNPIIEGGKVSKLQEIKNIITDNRPLEEIKIDFENDEGAYTTVYCSYFFGEFFIYDYNQKSIPISNDDDIFYLEGAKYTLKDAGTISFCKRYYRELK